VCIGVIVVEHTLTTRCSIDRRLCCSLIVEHDAQQQRGSWRHHSTHCTRRDSHSRHCDSRSDEIVGERHDDVDDALSSCEITRRHCTAHNCRSSSSSSDATNQQSTVFTLIIRPLGLLTAFFSVTCSQCRRQCMHHRSIDQQSQHDDTASTSYHHYTAADDIKQSRQSTIANK